MTGKDLRKLKLILSPSQFGVVEAMQKHGGWISNNEINIMGGSACGWKRLSEIDRIYEINKNEGITVPELEPVYRRKERWTTVTNRRRKEVKIKQFKLG